MIDLTRAVDGPILPIGRETGIVIRVEMTTPNNSDKLKLKGTTHKHAGRH